MNAGPELGRMRVIGASLGVRGEAKARGLVERAWRWRRADSDGSVPCHQGSAVGSGLVTGG